MTDSPAFKGLVERQARFSEEMFGPGRRTKGVIQHVRKELEEVAESNGSLEEWIDVIILGLDGAWREAAFGDRQCSQREAAQAVVVALMRKQALNEIRRWPDWRTCSPDEAVEHER